MSKKTVRKTLTQEKIKQFNRTQRNSARDTNVTNTQTELKENSAYDTYVTNSLTELKENSAPATFLYQMLPVHWHQ